MGDIIFFESKLNLYYLEEKGRGRNRADKNRETHAHTPRGDSESGWYYFDTKTYKS